MENADHWNHICVLNCRTSVLENPRIPKNKLSGYPNRYKIKLRSIGYHLVYEVIDEVIIIVIAVGRCENNAVYNEANSRHS
jgi:mRNA interferase RelE/StbE